MIRRAMLRAAVYVLGPPPWNPTWRAFPILSATVFGLGYWAGSVFGCRVCG